VTDSLLGTIEYGLHHLHTPLLVILGHSSCGAVKAALSMNELPDSPLGELLKLVKPSADAAAAECGASDATIMAIKLNVFHSLDTIMKKSETVREMVESGHVKVKTAVYDLESGLVSELHQLRLIPKNGDEAWARLKAGNEHFAKGHHDHKHHHAERSVAMRKTLTDGQKPFVTILCCSDSRVPPEVIFGEGLGAVFIIRVAGNVVDDALLGTIEYGLHHLHTPLLLIMGHSSCGAVKAALSMNDLPNSPLGELIKLVKPAADAAVAASGDADPTNEAIRLNILRSKELALKSQIVHELVEEGHVKVITAVYDLETGLVSEVN